MHAIPNEDMLAKWKADMQTKLAETGYILQEGFGDDLRTKGYLAERVFYTVGLTTLGFPEIVVVTSYHSMEDVSTLVRGQLESWKAAERLSDDHRKGYKVTFSVNYVFETNRSPVAITITRGQELTRPCFATRVLDRYVPEGIKLVQLVLPSPEGHLPWEEGYDHERYLQTDLNSVDIAQFLREERAKREETRDE